MRLGTQQKFTRIENLQKQELFIVLQFFTFLHWEMTDTLRQQQFFPE